MAADHDFNAAVRRSGISACSGLPRLEHYVTPRRHASTAPFPQTWRERARRAWIARRNQRRQHRRVTAALIVLAVLLFVVLPILGDGTHTLVGGPQ